MGEKVRVKKEQHILMLCRNKRNETKRARALLKCEKFQVGAIINKQTGFFFFNA